MARLCECGCGTALVGAPTRKYVSDSHRKRARRRNGHRPEPDTDPDMSPDAAVSDPDSEPEPVGGVELATRAFAETLPLSSGDPRGPLLEAAIAMAREVDRSGFPGAARELSRLLQHASEFERQVSEMDRVRTRYAARRVQHLLGDQGA